MADTGKKFRFTPVGGFRRQDVIMYIEALMKEHHEEVDGYRTSAELLRRERDDARDKVMVLQAQVDELIQRSKQLPSMQSDMESLKSRVNQLSAERTRQSEMLQKMEGAREGDRTALSRLQFLLSEREGRLAALQTQNDEFVSAYASAEDLEKRAVEGAQAIESEALEDAERIRDLIAQLWLDTKERYAMLCKEAEEASVAAVSDLEKARVLMLGARQVFDGVNDRLESLPLTEITELDSQDPFLPIAGEVSSLQDMLAQQKQAQIVPEYDPIEEEDVIPEEEEEEE